MRGGDVAFAGSTELHGIDEVIGEVDEGGFELEGPGLEGLVVVADGMDEVGGKAPGLDQGGADLGVVEAQDLAFGGPEEHGVLGLGDEDIAGAAGGLLVDDEAADVVEEAGDEVAFGFGDAAGEGEDAGGDPAGQAVSPEGLHVDQVGRDAIEHFDDGGHGDEVLDLLDADEVDGFGDGFDAGGEAEEGAIAEAEEAGGEIGVLFDDIADIGQVALGIGQHLLDFAEDAGAGAQAGDALDEGFNRVGHGGGGRVGLGASR